MWLFRPSRSSDPTRLPRPTSRPSKDPVTRLRQTDQAGQFVSVTCPSSIFSRCGRASVYHRVLSFSALGAPSRAPGGGKLEGGPEGPDPFTSRWDAAEVSTASEFRSLLAASFRGWLCPPGFLRELPRLALLLRCLLFAVPPPALMRLRHNAVQVRAVLAFVGGKVI